MPHKTLILRGFWRIFCFETCLIWNSANLRTTRHGLASWIRRAWSLLFCRRLLSRQKNWWTNWTLPCTGVAPPLSNFSSRFTSPNCRSSPATCTYSRVRCRFWTCHGPGKFWILGAGRKSRGWRRRTTFLLTVPFVWSRLLPQSRSTWTAARLLRFQVRFCWILPRWRGVGMKSCAAYKGRTGILLWRMALELLLSAYPRPGPTQGAGKHPRKASEWRPVERKATEMKWCERKARVLKQRKKRAALMPAPGMKCRHRRPGLAQEMVRRHRSPRGHSLQLQAKSRMTRWWRFSTRGITNAATSFEPMSITDFLQGGGKGGRGVGDDSIREGTGMPLKSRGLVHFGAPFIIPRSS